MQRSFVLQASEVSRAVGTVKSTAAALGLIADDAVVLQNANRLAVHLLPCDSLARVAPKAWQTAMFEVGMAQQLAAAGAPLAVLEPRVPPRPHERDGFVVTFWTYYEPVTSDVPPADYASAYSCLHAGMRKIEIEMPHFTDRVSAAQHLLANPDRTPELANADREFLSGILENLRRTILDRGAAEQPLHGEPHPGNVLNTKIGPLFIDLETCCRGPIEFDLAHAPETVIEYYPSVDHALLSDCRALVLAMVAAWRWDAADRFPNGRQWAELFIRTLRKGAPWPSLQAVSRQFQEHL